MIYKCKNNVTPTPNSYLVSSAKQFTNSLLDFFENNYLFLNDAYAAWYQFTFDNFIMLVPNG